MPSIEEMSGEELALIKFDSKPLETPCRHGVLVEGLVRGNRVIILKYLKGGTEERVVLADAFGNN